MADEVRYRGRWLHFHERVFTDAHGAPKRWEYVSRHDAARAVCIVAVTDPPDPRLILVRQMRQPLRAEALEFPAGLIDPGETVEAAALRELAEETGCRGAVTAVGPFVYSSPGLTDESVAWVRVRVSDRNPHRPEPDETIHVLELPLERLREALAEHAAAGLHVDAKLWFFAEGLAS
jgi:ADP-ribose pyrophosphatase